MEFQPERYLKNGKLNPDVRDPDCAAFGFGRWSVSATIYSPTYAHFIVIRPQLCPSATTRYTRLYIVFSRYYMTSNHQSTTREILSSPNLSSLLECCVNMFNMPVLWHSIFNKQRLWNSLLTETGTPFLSILRIFKWHQCVLWLAQSVGRGGRYNLQRNWQGSSASGRKW